ncbi:MAG: caspase domain-containing protein, partial [Candidatus Hodarchaeota archaeon]
MGNKKFKGYAFLVGVGSYDDPRIPKLPAAITEVSALAERLKQCGYAKEIRVISKNTTRDYILGQLDAFCTKLKKLPNKTNATVFIYLVAHGVIFREPLHEQDEKYCFLASDTTYQIKDKGLELDNTISSEAILKRLRPLEAKHLAILFNTCFAGRVKRKKYEAEGLAPKAVRLSEFKELSHSKNWIVGAACKEEEYSYIDDTNPTFEISYFGKYLLSGLTRHAPGLLDIITLFRYIKDEVTQEIKSLNFTQTPFIIETKKLNLDQRQLRVFPIALLPQVKTPVSYETPTLPDMSPKTLNQPLVGLDIGMAGEIDATTEKMTLGESKYTHIEAKEVYIGSRPSVDDVPSPQWITSTPTLDPSLLLGFRSKNFSEKYYKTPEFQTFCACFTDPHINSVFLAGKAIAGKSRMVYEWLRRIKVEFSIPQKDNWSTLIPIVQSSRAAKQTRIIIFDNLNEYLDDRLFFDFFKLCLQTPAFYIVATCQSAYEQEVDQVLFKQFNVRTKGVFDAVITLEVLTDLQKAERIANYLGRPWRQVRARVKAHGTIGAIVLDLDAMIQRYSKCSLGEKSILRSLKYAYYTGLYTSHDTYNVEWVKLLACDRFDLDPTSWQKGLETLKNWRFLDWDYNDIQ